MNNEYFIEQLSKEFKLERENTIKLLNKVRKYINNNKDSNMPITKNFLARTIIHNLNSIRNTQDSNNKLHLTKIFTHTCFYKHFKKFEELEKLDWGDYKISEYFKNVLKCSISRPTVKKILTHIRENRNV